jgi:hypothetical protein
MRMSSTLNPVAAPTSRMHWVAAWAFRGVSRRPHDLFGRDGGARVNGSPMKMKMKSSNRFNHSTLTPVARRRDRASSPSELHPTS